MDAQSTYEIYFSLDENISSVFSKRKLVPIDRIECLKNAASTLLLNVKWSSLNYSASFHDEALLRKFDFKSC